MQRHALVVIFSLFCSGFLAFPVLSQEKQKQDAGKQQAQDSEKTDITADVRAMNSDLFEAPPTQFRPGKVKPRQLAADALSKDVEGKTKGKIKGGKGFTIQLPSKAPIPTPTVYKGKLYVSGGFQSREFYCFDAVTGQTVWAVELDDDGPTSAVCENDICVFNTESCTIFALDAKTGKQLWSHFLGDPLTSTPTIANGKVFTSYPISGGEAVEEALKQTQSANGQKIGAKGSPQPAPPAIVLAKKDKKEAEKLTDNTAKQQRVQRPNATHVLCCIDLKTGKILWQRWIDSDVMSAPVAVYGDIYATSFAGTVYRFSQEKGTILSAQRSRATSAPVVVGAHVYMTNRADSGKDRKVQEQIKAYGRALTLPQYASPPRDAAYLDESVQKKSELDKAGKALDQMNGFGGGAPAAANPKAAAENVGQANVSTMQAFQGSRILNFQNANFNCMGNEVVCSEPATGKVKWNLKLQGDLEKLGGFLATPPAAAGGQLFLGTVQGEILQVDPEKGTIVQRYQVGSPIRFQPAIEAGRIYVGTQNGKVVCIDTQNAQFTGWSTWGANAAHSNVLDTTPAR